MQKLGFSIFSVLSLNFEDSLFLGLLKHYKNRGFSNFLCFVLLKEKKTGKKMITGIYEFGFFWSKNGRFVTHNCFSKKKNPETTIFIVFFVCALCGPSCQKREILDTQPKKKKIFIDNWKAHFWVFFVFSFFFFCFFFFFFFGVLLFFLLCFFCRV